MSRCKFNRNQVVPYVMVPEFNNMCIAALAQPRITPTTIPIKILGTKSLSPNARDSYLSRLRMLVQFLLHEKDFDDSLAIFYPFTPKGTITVQVEAVEMFMLSKYTPKGGIVIDRYETPIEDDHGNFLRGMGGWNDPDIACNLRSALSCVHGNAHDMAGDYRPKCEDCAEQFEQFGSGCRHHASSPRPTRTGNVRKSHIFGATTTYMQTLIKHTAT